MERRYALFAVKPEFAEALVEGRKRFELRRTRPSLRTGDVVYVYATSPVKAVLGSFVCGSVVEGSPTGIWIQVGGEVEVSRRRFRDYFRSATRAFAIEVMSPRTLSEPLTLDELRLSLPGFCPPQSYKFVPKKLGLAV